MVCENDGRDDDIDEVCANRKEWILIIIMHEGLKG